MASGELVAFASVVDNVTGGGFLVPAVRASSFAADLVLNGVARAPGRNGTFWSRDVRLLNPGSTPLAVSLAALGIAGAGGAPLVRQVPPRGIVALEDVLGPSGLDLGEGVAGGLRVTADRPFLAAARAVNSGVSGSFGALLGTVPFPGGLDASTPAAFTGLGDVEGSTGFRSNVALLSGIAPSAGTGVLRDADGIALSSPFRLAGGEWRQTSLSGWLGLSSVGEGSRLGVLVSQGTAEP